MSEQEVQIGGRRIGRCYSPLIVAEISANHLGCLERALTIVDRAAEAGVGAIKIQTYTADTLTIDCDRPEFHMQGGLWDGETLYSLYQNACTPWEWHQEIFDRAQKLGLLAFSSPFDLSAVQFLESLDVPAYKIASFELVDHALIAACAQTGKPVLMSTGMASPGEIDEAVTVARDNGCDQLVVLHCLSGYPSPPEEFNLSRLESLQRETGALVGLSDHSAGSTVAIAASALGASVIEKHITLRRSDGGPDAAFSLEPHEFASVVTGATMAWKALGNGVPVRAASESVNIKYRRSLYVVEDIEEGERFTEKNTRSIRPHFGLAPKYMASVLGSRAATPIKRGTPLSWALVAHRWQEQEQL